MNEAAQGNGGSGEDDPSPMNLLSAARRAVPAEDYALGVAGIAAVGAIVITAGDRTAVNRRHVQILAAT